MRSPRAFTLIELLVTLTIIGLLIAAAGVSYSGARRNSRDTVRIGDVLLIGKAIDQAVVATRGTYPQRLIQSGESGTAGDFDVGPASDLRRYTRRMCAHHIIAYNAGSLRNPNNIDVSTFKKNTIPKDPMPLDTNANVCYQVSRNSNPDGVAGEIRAGYIYHTLYTSTPDNDSSRDAVAWTAKVNYAIEVGLENERPDETALRNHADVLFSSATMTNRTNPYAVSNSSRYRYYLLGPYCSTIPGVGCYF